MQRNRKLTAVIGGRAVTALAPQGDVLTVRFDDGSVMTVRTDGPGPATGAMGRVHAVRQSGTAMALDYEDGTSLALRTAEATSCVMVRSGTGTFEYAD